MRTNEERREAAQRMYDLSQISRKDYLQILKKIDCAKRRSQKTVEGEIDAEIERRKIQEWTEPENFRSTSEARFAKKMARLRRHGDR